MFRSGMRLLRTTGAGALVVAVLSAPAAAQTAVTGAVRGTLRSTRGELLGDALVTLVDAHSGSRYQAVTSRSGEYRIPRLPAGDYAAIAEQIGYAPLYLAGVPVRPGVELDLPLTVREGAPAQLAIDSAVFAAGTTPLGRSAAARWLGGSVIRLLPYAEPQLVESARLVTWLDRALGAEGLPARFSATALEGHPFRVAGHPFALGGAGSLLAPQAASAVEVIRAPVDAEWSGAAGTLFSALARRGAEGVSGALEGEASAGPLAQAGFFDAGGESPRAIRAAGLLEGFAFGDSARYALGGTFRSDDVLLSPRWPDTDENRAAAAAGAWIGQLESNFAPQLETRESVSGFGQLDWRLAAGQRLGVTFAASKPADEPALAPGAGAAWPVEGQDLLAGMSLFTDLGQAGNQVRLSWASSTRESFGTNPTAYGLLVPGSLRLNGSESARFEESTIRVLDAVHVRAGQHGFKLGGDLAVTTHDQAWRRGGVAEVLFGGVTQLQQSIGVFRQTRGSSPSLSWNGQALGLFLQDTWQGESGLGVTAALRAERHSVSETPARDQEWYRLTSIPNDSISSAAWRLSPRLDVTWAAGEQRQFLVNASAGLYHDPVDALLVGEWLVDDGSAQVDRYVGNVGVWTVGRPAGATSRTRLTLPGTDFRGPETLRATGGFAFVLDPRTTLALDAGYRHTRFLPSRRDLNLLPAQLAEDQYGRPVFGTLVKQGELVAAVPGSNRRFPEYDEVTALDLDAASTWFGGTVRVDRQLAADVQLAASYTFSRTRDDWFGAAAGGGVGSAAPGLGQAGDWGQGTSDFDVPHRAALFASWASPLGLTVSGLVRYESGRPFTPGFPLGVDVNGDGFTGNDPAFVDPAVPGVTELVARWDCLRRANGRFAERNECRAAATTTVDARLELRLLDLGRGGLAATAQLLDLLETDFSPADAALYRIDPAGTLVQNSAVVTVPLLANPDFGEPLVRARTGRTVRLGLALTW